MFHENTAINIYIEYYPVDNNNIIPLIQHIRSSLRGDINNNEHSSRRKSSALRFYIGHSASTYFTH